MKDNPFRIALSIVAGVSGILALILAGIGYRESGRIDPDDDLLGIVGPGADVLMLAAIVSGVGWLVVSALLWREESKQATEARGDTVRPMG